MVMGLTVGAMVPTTEAALAFGPSAMTVFIVFGGHFKGFALMNSVVSSLIISTQLMFSLVNKAKMISSLPSLRLKIIQIACSVSIKSLFDSTKIVAKGVVRSMDPNIEV